MTSQLLVKDANTVAQPIGVETDASGFLAPQHAACSLDPNGVAWPASGLHPMPVYNPGNVVAADSGQLQAGGQAQVIFGGLTPTNGYLVANLSQTELMYVTDVGMAAVPAPTTPSIPIAPGAIFTTPSGYKPPGSVSIVAATTGHPYSARRW